MNATKPSPEIANHLATVRRKRGLSAAWLATAVGVSRQTIYAIEAGSYIPNTVVGLRLARALAVGVEELFALPADTAAPAMRSEAVRILPGSDAIRTGQPGYWNS